ncbi:MAG: GNAT family N-acetyltransferase [Candidatus Thorarchaeota archaeon]
MITLSKDDPRAEKHRDTIRPYVGGYDSRKVPYYIIEDNDQAVGVVIVGEEPLKIIEPIGTMVSVVLIIDYNQHASAFDEFAGLALEIAKESKAAYSFIDLPNKYPIPISSFMNCGYKELAHSLRMSRILEDIMENETSLRFEKVERREVIDFLDKMKEFMVGSHDAMVDIIFSNLGRLPDSFQDQFYGTELLFWVYLEKELIGILDICPGGVASIANIGVNPVYRGRKYSRQIMLYAMNLLKDLGKERAGLRVHMENKVALQLYESLGFSKEASHRALIWRK